jgi:ribosomal protein S18 acetylase RimI-like enzyme
MTDASVEYRTPSEDDYPAVAAALQAWWTQPGLDTPAHARERAALVPRLWLQHFGGTSVVAERDGRLQGFLVAFFSQDRRDHGYIHFVGVSPDARQLGIGRALYEQFFARCRAAGRTRVSCLTSPVNALSIAFHRAMGFSVSSPKTDYDGPLFDRVVFERSLARPW